MRGRKPTPTLLADLHGRPRKNNAPPNEPKPVTGDLGAPPEWMTAEIGMGWHYAITHAPPGLLKQIDRGALAVWVMAEHLRRQAVTAQLALPLLVKAPISGAAIQSPYLPIINRQGLIMLKAASELGFTPVSRPRIGIVAPLPIVYQDESIDQANAPRKSLDEFLASHPDRQQRH